MIKKLRYRWRRYWSPSLRWQDAVARGLAEAKEEERKRSGQGK